MFLNLFDDHIDGILVWLQKYPTEKCKDLSSQKCRIIFLATKCHQKTFFIRSIAFQQINDIFGINQSEIEKYRKILF